MVQLSSKERIKRVEMVPIEVQTMVAKAFLRDDVDDEDVQYLFNIDIPEESNDANEHYEIENLNTDELEGVVTAAIVVQGKKAIQGVVDLTNISSDTEVITWEVKDNEE